MATPRRRIGDLARGETPVLGIDFGTTNTVAAWFDSDGEVQLVPISNQSHTLPSIVHYGPSGKTLVGTPARQEILDDPPNTIFGFKRFLGRRFDSPFVAEHRGRYAYDLCEGADGQVAVRIRNEVIHLEEVAARVFDRITELCRAMGPRFEECVLTVPSHFTLRQREMIRVVAENSGLQVRAMVNEPTAAALYYAKQRTSDELVLVYDLGGGTFDATLLRVRRGIAEVIGTGGDAFLGGANFDERIAEHLLETFERTHGLDLRGQAIVMQRVAFAAETAKIALSTEESFDLRVPLVAKKEGRFLDLVHRLDRDELESIVAPLVERTLGLCREMIDYSGVPTAEISEMVFAGGQTRMPAIHQRMAQVFKVDPTERADPSFGVAIGAAMLGQGPQLLSDVLSVPIWAMAAGAAAKKIIPQNTFLPCALTYVLSIRPTEGQPLVVVVYQSLEEASTDRDILGILRAPAAWLSQNSGALTLEVRMSQACELSFFLEAAQGRRVPLELTPP